LSKSHQMLKKSPDAEKPDAEKEEMDFHFLVFFHAYILTYYG
jgi:hypothetical protein